MSKVKRNMRRSNKADEADLANWIMAEGSIREVFPAIEVTQLCVDKQPLEKLAAFLKTKNITAGVKPETTRPRSCKMFNGRSGGFDEDHEANNTPC